MAKKTADPIKGFKLRWWQVSLFKLSCVSFGILAGLYFWDFFSEYTPLLWLTTLVPGGYLAYVWYKQR